MAHPSFVILSVDRTSGVDSTGRQRMRGLVDIYFTSGRRSPRFEMQGNALVESPPGSPRTPAAIEADIITYVRGEVNRLDAIDATPVPVSLVAIPQTPTRYDATTGIAILVGDTPAPDATPPRL